MLAIGFRILKYAASGILAKQFEIFVLYYSEKKQSVVRKMSDKCRAIITNSYYGSVSIPYGWVVNLKLCNTQS